MSMVDKFYCSEKINQLQIHKGHKKSWRRKEEFKRSLQEKF